MVDRPKRPATDHVRILSERQAGDCVLVPSERLYLRPHTIVDNMNKPTQSTIRVFIDFVIHESKRLNCALPISACSRRVSPIRCNGHRQYLHDTSRMNSYTYIRYTHTHLFFMLLWPLGAAPVPAGHEHRPVARLQVVLHHGVVLGACEGFAVVAR